MKKSAKLIPIISIIAAVLVGAFVTVFTTSLTYNLCSADNYETVYDENGSRQEADDCFFASKKVGAIMRFAYRLNPSFENLVSLAEIYSPSVYLRGTYRGDTPPSDYLEYTVKYQKLYYETEYVEEESPYVAVALGEENFNLYYKVNRGLDYAKALYLNSQVEQSQKIVEQLIESVQESHKNDRKGSQRYDSNGNRLVEINDNYSIYLELRDYFYLVYSTAEDKAVKQWVLDTESTIEKDVKKSEKMTSYIGRHGYLFSNPDYETFMSGTWPENQDSKYIDFFSEERENEEQYPQTEPSGEYFRTEPALNNRMLLNYRRGEGIYTVLSNEKGKFNTLAIVDNDGKVIKTLLEIDDGEILYAYPIGDLIWFLGGNTIYRLFIPTNAIDKIYDEVKVTNTDDTHFFRFLYPISNFEIEWIEAFRDDEQKMYFEKAYYYRSTDNLLIEKEFSFPSGVNDFFDLAMPEKNWWREGDRYLKSTQMSVYICIDRAFWPESYSKSLKECRKSGISYICYPAFNVFDDSDRVEYKRMMEIQDKLENWINSEFYQKYDFGNGGHYYVESKYEIIGGRTKITFAGEKEDTATEELHPFETSFWFDFVLTDKVKGLNSFDNNYLS